ncbi:HAD-superfamily subfamily IB hydrolase, TIGR01490 [Actinokineospora alba]|uniref:HAD-superfamily subfamily IB hydrolase, TIGR01490 n=1 Tax=Actinokineospora alba TaxID=504798 RepID=A0A1H0SZY3_9PSEU|nr:HAD-IB family hydrolase [Actinokineospora alba]TDP66454.1 HAD superfamily hydrolase (TIGR01490 family) [Actinokineospora alba]SDJ52046.1 HAD-superfamily subfamily IB hydrolase, TIGR01490 [Actinokineospora alba]SDP47121.1 HAD-superfamily subfamily IB hydrolase, TIGR01490 [Actinokineospora alba]
MTDSGNSADPLQPGRIAAFFDLDKTVIAKSSTLAFSRPFFQGGLINRRGVLKSAYAQFVFAASGADADQVERMREHLTSLCAGWDVEQVRSIVEETLHDIVDPLVYAEAAELVAEHQANGHEVVVISASGEEIVAPIAEMIGATHSVGTRMVSAEGRYTGEIDFYCYGDNKAAAIRELAEQHGYDLAASHAYSDSSTDLPMLEAVGHPAVVNPDRGLRKIATERGWPILTFSKPVSLRSRFHAPSGTTVAVTAIGLSAAAAAAGAAWYGYRRRRR